MVYITSGCALAENRFAGLTEAILDQYQAKAGQANALNDRKLADSFWDFANAMGSSPVANDNMYRGSVSGLLRNLIAKQVDLNNAAAAQAAEVKKIEDSGTDPAAQQRLGIQRKNIGRSSTILAGGNNMGGGSLNSSGSLTARRYLLGA